MPADGALGRRYTCPKADFLPHHAAPTIRGHKSFTDGERGLQAETAESALDAHLEIGLQQSDQRSSWLF